MKLITVLAALVASGSAQALSIDCGRLLDVKSGRWLEGARLTVSDGKFASVAKAESRAEGEVVDLSGYSCLPGLIDMHTHLTLEFQPHLAILSDQLQANPADYALRSAVYAKRTLQAGFTTVRDVGASDGLDVSLKRAIEQGWVEGPRMFVAGTGISTTGGHGDPTNSLSRELSGALGRPGPRQGIISGPQEARDAVRQCYKDGADLIKISATGGVLSQAASGQNAQFTDEELRAVVEAANDYGFKVAAHAHGADGLKRALRAGVSSIEHGTYMDDEAIALYQKTGAWYVPTISAGRTVAERAKLPDYYSPLVRPKAAAIGPIMQGTLSRAYKAGVKIAFGTDAGVFAHGENAKEFVYMVEAGMPTLAALRAATLGAAALLGKSDQLGSVETGFAADLIAVKDDPLRDVAALQNVAFVMKAGKIYKQPMTPLKPQP